MGTYHIFYNARTGQYENSYGERFDVDGGPVVSGATTQTFTVAKTDLLARITAKRDEEVARQDAAKQASSTALAEVLQIALDRLAAGKNYTVDDEDEASQNGGYKTAKYVGRATEGVGRVEVHIPGLTTAQMKALNDTNHSQFEVVNVKQLEADIEFLNLVVEDTIEVSSSDRFSRYLPRG
jgi:hypothetical protein